MSDPVDPQDPLDPEDNVGLEDNEVIYSVIPCTVSTKRNKGLTSAVLLTFVDCFTAGLKEHEN